MKVLSIKEPYASLICCGMKKIETRSWKTNYRGEIFIHASKKIDTSYLTSEELYEIVNDMEFFCGNIICKAELVDCIYMDQEFIKSIQTNKVEYACGEYKEGRYAWVLENVEPIYPIMAKGKLNIWNYEGDYKLLKK